MSVLLRLPCWAAQLGSEHPAAASQTLPGTAAPWWALVSFWSLSLTSSFSSVFLAEAPVGLKIYLISVTATLLAVCLGPVRRIVVFTVPFPLRPCPYSARPPPRNGSPRYTPPGSCTWPGPLSGQMPPLIRHLISITQSGTLLFYQDCLSGLKQNVVSHILQMFQERKEEK